MYFKIRKANDHVIYLNYVPTDCRKWHVVFDENGAFNGIKCSALRKQLKCKNCRLAHTIRKQIRRKTYCNIIKK